MFWRTKYTATFVYVLLQITGFTICEKIPLYIGCLQELSELPSWYQKGKFYPQVVEYALDTIRNRTGILEQYEIHTVVRDVKVLFGESTPNIDTSSKLYNTLFNVNMMTKELNILRIEMMKYFGWSRVGTIAKDGDNWKYQVDHFHELLDENNMTLVSSAVLTYQRSSRDIIRTFKQFDVKIIMAAIMGSDARDIFCEAYHQGLYGNGYVWVISAPTMFYAKIIGGTDENEMSCTIEELMLASNGHFRVDYKYVTDSQETTISGKTPQQVMADIIEMHSKTNYTFDSIVGVLYDAVWALALGLNKSIKYLEDEGLQLHEYNYSDVYLRSVMNGLREVHFNGVSGPVSFDEFRNRIGITYIQQSFNDNIVDIATYNPRLDYITWLVPVETLWPCQDVPKDRFTYEANPVPPSTEAFAIVVVIDIIGFVFSLTFLVYNVYHRNNRFIKMSSPMLNNVIIAGSFLMYTEVMLTAVDYRSNTNVNMCMIHTWLKVIGFTVLFGALFSKTYRVYVIFRNAQLKSKIVKDAHLFLMIGFMLVIDLVILLPWSIIDPLRKERHLAEVQNREDNNVISTEIYFHCSDTYQTYWVAATYVYKGLLLAFGLFLAWETRHVNVPALNDSKYIGACIYNVVIVCIFGVPLAHVLPVEQSTLAFVLETILILFCTVICLCIIFIPKIQMQKQVQGRFVTEQMTSRMATLNGQGTVQTLANEGARSNETATGSISNRTVLEVEEENKTLRIKIAAEAEAIAKLKKSLTELTGNVHFYKSGSEYVLIKVDGPNSSSCKQDQHTKSK